MLCLELWAFEVMAIFSAFISLTATACQVITLNTAALFFMVVIGLQSAGSVLVGQNIGSMNVAKAKKYQKLIQLMGIGLALLLGTTIYLCRYFISEFYTNITEV